MQEDRGIISISSNVLYYCSSSSAMLMMLQMDYLFLVLVLNNVKYFLAKYLIAVDKSGVLSFCSSAQQLFLLFLHKFES